MPAKSHFILSVLTLALILRFSFPLSCYGGENSIELSEIGDRLAVGPEPYFVLIEDFNDDQLPDMAVANRGDLKAADHSRPGNDTISVLLSKAKGEFHPAVDYQVGFGPYTIKSGDFDRDGLTDLAVVCFQSNDDRDVAILKGQKDGRFLESQYLKVNEEFPYNKNNLPNGTPAYATPGLTSLVIADVDSDGNQDIVTVGWSCDAIVTFLGDGKGGFPHQKAIKGIPSGPRDVAVSDFNRDGSPDLALTHYNSDRITIWRGDSKGQFTKQADFHSGGQTPYHLRIADLNSDGRNDLVVGNRGPSDDVSLFLGEGDFHFSLVGRHSAGKENHPEKIEYEIRDVEVADLDGDGSVEVVAACRLANRIVIWKVIKKKGRPTLQFAGEYQVPDAGPRAFGIADFDQDGTKDLATVLATARRVVILKAKGH